jgi:prepilin-type N-terminal cleavage/methylation domain-containing protein
MKNVRFPRLHLPGMVRDEKGFTLIEVMISVVLLGIVTAALASGLITASKVLLRNDVHQTAQNLAEYVLESVKNQPYQEVSNPIYPAILPPQTPIIYTATITATVGTDITAFNPSASPPQGRNIKLQKITVQIFKNGTLTYTLDGYKVE